MKYLFLTIVAVTTSVFAQAQSSTPADSAAKADEKIYMVVDYQAEYKGGHSALRRYLAKNFEYPKSARDAGIHGQVFVSFIVEKDGSITDIAIVKGVQADCDKEAIRVISIMRPWRPGRKGNGEIVRSRFVLPVGF